MTTAQVREQTKAIFGSIAQQKEVSQRSGEQFASIAPADLEKSVKAAKAPSLGMFSWPKMTAPGARLDMSVFVLNPESNPAPNIYVHVWVAKEKFNLFSPGGRGNVEGDPHQFHLTSRSQFIWGTFA